MAFGLAVHLLLSGLHVAIYRSFKLKLADRISSSWLHTIVLFLPAAGFLVAALLLALLFLTRYREDFYEEYKEYVYQEAHSLETYSVNVEKESNRVPFREILMSGEHTGKKEALFSLLQYEGENKVQLIQEALRDDDAEVVHYAATGLNYMNEQFVRRIKTGIRQVQGPVGGSLESWKELLQTYRQYLESRLLTEELALEVREAYRQWIRLAREKYPQESSFLAEQCYLHRSEGHFSEAAREAAKLADSKEYSYLARLTKAEQLFAEGRWEALREFCSGWWESGAFIPEEHGSAVEFWKELTDQGVPQNDYLLKRYR
ncbi:hypothetical protein N6H14_02485 [Paenibacillus sp. CC-CFT747]|nr:hypothetical protein N6H14_02485 [Paenibacillus sp. CC-CFT747]